MSAETELRLAIRATNPQVFAQLSQLQQQLGQTGAGSMRQLQQGAQAANQEIERIGQFGKFSFQVLQAFLLYKGFVFLKDQVVEFTRELVEMEHQILLTQTQLNNLGKDFRASLTEDVADVARETGQAYTELAQTQYEIVSANIDVSSSYRVLELAAKAAVSGGLKDVSLAFDAALTQANAFGISIENLDRILDKQFVLVKRGIFSYEQYARVAGEIAIAFSSIGQNVEVANAALAAVSQVFTGPQLREGATGLKNAALALAENADAFEAFGLRLHDEEGNFRNFIDIVEDLQEALSGLSPREREAVLLDLFDEKRARRGIQTLLREVDSLNQFYVEQQFALGDLDEAYQTVNESLSQQARIFKNELIPAAEPFIRVLADILGLVNGLANVAGGPQNLGVALAGITGGAALGAAARFRGISPVSARTLAIPNVGLPSTMFGASTAYQVPLPSAATLGVGALGGALAFEQGRMAGNVSLAQAFTTVGGATAGGALFGGPVGALTFGGIAAAGLILGEALQEEAPEVAQGFAEAFREALVEESMNVAVAFSKAVAESAGTSGFERFFSERALYGGTVFETRDRSLREQVGLILGLGVARDEFKRSREVLGLRGALETATEARQIPGLQQLITQNRISGIIQAGAEAQRLAEQTQGVFGINPADARAVAIRTAIDDLIPDDLAEESRDAASALETFVNAMVDASLTTEQQTEAFGLLQRGFESGDFRGAMVAFSDFIRQVEQGRLPQADQFGIISLRVQGLVEGEISPLIEVFNELGEEGRDLAEAFQRVQDTMERFTRLQDVLELQFSVTETRRVPLQGPVPAPSRQLLPSGFDVNRPFGQQPSASEGLGSVDVQVEVQRTVLDLINRQFQNAPITREELATAFYDKLREDIGNAFNQKFPDLSREQVVEFLVGGGPQPVIVPAMTGLADSVLAAKQAIEDDLIPSFGFTSAQLDDLAGTFESFNRQVFKVGIVQELQRLGQIAGFGTSGLQGVIDDLVSNIEIAGLTFQEVLGDPRRLADLLAELKFGDVEIDQSSNFQIAVRVEGAMDTAAAVQAAETIYEELNRRMRQARSTR